MIRIGFDIGGSKLAAIALDAGGRELARARRAVPRGYGATIGAETGAPPVFGTSIPCVSAGRRRECTQPGHRQGADLPAVAPPLLSLLYGPWKYGTRMSQRRLKSLRRSGLQSILDTAR